MSASILTYTGETDGVRYGAMRFSDGEHRRYLWDKLSATPRLFFPTRSGEIEPRIDDDPIHVEDALDALRGRG